MHVTRTDSARTIPPDAFAERRERKAIEARGHVVEVPGTGEKVLIPEGHERCFTLVLDPPACPRCRQGHINKRGGDYGCCQCNYRCSPFDANSMYDHDPDEPGFGMGEWS